MSEDFFGQVNWEFLFSKLGGGGEKMFLALEMVLFMVLFIGTRNKENKNQQFKVHRRRFTEEISFVLELVLV